MPTPQSRRRPPQLRRNLPADPPPWSDRRRPGRYQHLPRRQSTAATTPRRRPRLLAALGGFTGTLGATNTAGLLSGYTPPSGLALSATGGRATALIVETDEPLAVPLQRNGSGRWATGRDDEEADRAPTGRAPAPRRRAGLAEPGRVVCSAAWPHGGGCGGVDALSSWPAPRTTDSAISRPAPLVPALAARPRTPIGEPRRPRRSRPPTGRGRRRFRPRRAACPRHRSWRRRPPRPSR